MKLIRRLAAVALLLCAWPAASAQAEALAGQASVIDGDTIEIHGQRLRLYGIDAPESHQLCQRDGKAYRCGQEAANALAGKLAGKAVMCTVLDRDRYRRLVSRCEVGGEDINRWMVANGQAVAYRQYSRDYIADEASAQAERRGLWQGRFQTPADYRRSHKRPTALAPQAAPDPACAIKGNISAAGKRIYHLPGSRDYARTRITTASGERWFCSEEAARAAGWQKAQ